MSESATLRDDLRALPRAAWILFIGTFLNRFGSFVVPFLVLYLTKRGFTAGEAGIALGAYGVGHFFASVIGGQLADHLGRRRSIVLSMVLSAISMLALSQATSYVAIVLLALAAGSTAELYRPASTALVADLVPEGRRVTAYAVYRLAVNLGFAAGPATAGFLANRSFLLLFVGDAATSLLFAAVAFFGLPSTTRKQEHDVATGWLPALRSARHNPKFIAFLVAATFVMMVDFQMSSTLPLHVRDHGYSSATFGWLISINGLIIITTELAITRLTQRFNRDVTIAAGWFLICIGFALTGISNTLPALIGTVVMWTVGEMISSPLVVALVADNAEPHLRGRYMGLLGVSFSIGLTLGPPLGTALYGHSPSAVWMLCGVFGVVAAAIVILTRNVARRIVVV